MYKEVNRTDPSPSVRLPCLYYKCVLALALSLTRLTNYAHRVMLCIAVSLSDDSRGIIYDRNMFIVQATGVMVIKLFFVSDAAAK